MADIDNDKVSGIELGIVGSGSMGAGMTLLFSSKGSRIGCYDYDKEAVQKLIQEAKDDEAVDHKLVHGFTSIEKLIDAFGKEHKPRVFVLSLPHGKAVDGVLDDLLPRLRKGDIIIDGGNEWWEETERRQRKANEKGVEWVGMGVSGGCRSIWTVHVPGCTKEAWEQVRPLLEKWAARTEQDEPCVMRIGPGGAGHYVKMIHNGIEHAHLSILCEARGLLRHQLGMSNDDIADLFESWWKSGPLKGNFLVGIGFKGLRFQEGDGIQDKEGIVEDIEDKVTQDVDKSEGTGTWSTKEIAERHVAAPAIAAAHQLRIISADKYERLAVSKKLDLPQPSKAKESVSDELLEVFHQAVYGAILSAFVQGLNIIARASKDQEWDISLETCIKIWRSGCIIQSDAIAQFLLPLLQGYGPSEPLNLFQSIPEVGREVAKTFPAIKKVCALALETDAIAPALNASLDYLKAVNCRNLPTDFQEMELDYFGHHNYDIRGKAEKGHEKGHYHTEFSRKAGV